MSPMQNNKGKSDSSATAPAPIADADNATAMPGGAPGGTTTTTMEGTSNPLQMEPYEVGRRIGADHYTEVYEGRHRRLGLEVCLQQLHPAYAQDPRLRERFHRMAEVLTRLLDVNVISLHHYDPGDEKKGPFLAFERVRGQTLGDFLFSVGPLPPPLAVAFGCALGRVLGKMHDLGLVHRDVKPGHVTLDQDHPGRMVLSGFLWVLVPETVDTPSITRLGEVVGTLGYMAPEQALGEPVDEQVDIFALGVFIYELITGRLPFANSTREAYLADIKQQDYVPAEVIDPRVSPRLAGVLAGCLRCEPDERWGTVSEIVKLLERELHENLKADADIVLRDFLGDPKRYLDRLARCMGARLEERARALADAGQHADVVRTVELALKWCPQNPRLAALFSALPRVKAEGRARASVLRALLEQYSSPGDTECAGGVASQTDATVEAAGSPREEPVPGKAESLPRGQRSLASPRERGSNRTAEPGRKLPLMAERWHRGLVFAASLAAGLLGFVLGGHSWTAQPKLTDLFAQPLFMRQIAGRLTDPLIGRHLPYPLDDQGHVHPGPNGLNLNAVGELKKQGNFQAVAAAWVTDGSPGSLEQALACLNTLAPLPGEEDVLRMPLAPSRYPDIDSDRAAILLSQGKPEFALRLAESALMAHPEHRAAEWNRALALKDVGATILAAEAFEHIASHGERGWASEASARAAALRQLIELRRRDHEGMVARGRAMVMGGSIELSLWRRFPGYGRLFFYDAVRAATSIERVREFLPLAMELDRLQGGSVLADYVQKLLAERFDRRGPLAQTYARLAADYHALDAKAQDAYFAQLRAAHQYDLLLGALVLTDRVNEHLPEYRELARRNGDPWSVLILENEQANAEIERGEYPQAEERLAAASRACYSQGLTYRCIRLELALAQLYISLYALPQAEIHVKSGMKWARETGDWIAETSFLRKLVLIAFYRDESNLRMALVEEAARREPVGCKQQRYLHDMRADKYVRSLRFEEARREVLSSPLCDEPRSLPSLLVVAHLGRVGMAVMTPSQLHEGLEILSRQQGLTAISQANIKYAEGVLALQRDREEGRTLLSQTITMAKRLPSTDAEAHQVLSSSWEELLFDAGMSGDANRALRLMAEQRGLSQSAACVLGVVLSGERSLVVMRGMNGVARMHHEPFSEKAELNLKSLVPETFKAELQGCPQVTVYSNAALIGRPQLLQENLAWSFWERGPVRRDRTLCEENSLIIGDVDTPPELHLPPLSSWGNHFLSSRGHMPLLGLAATPSVALAGMTKATTLVVNAHVLTGVGISHVVLSPDESQKYAITADDLNQVRFTCAPPVFITSYSLPSSISHSNGTLSVPEALLNSGSGPVFAALTPPPEGEGRQFFTSVLERLRSGSSPAVALKDVRMLWLQQKRGDWVKNVSLFE